MEISDILELVIQQFKSSSTYTESYQFQRGINLCVNQSLNFLETCDDHQSTKTLSDEIKRRFHFNNYCNSNNNHFSQPTPNDMDFVLLDLSQNDLVINSKQTEYQSDDKINNKKYVLQKIREKIMNKRRINKNTNMQVIDNKNHQFEDEFMWRPW